MCKLRNFFEVMKVNGLLHWLGTSPDHIYAWQSGLRPTKQSQILDINSRKQAEDAQVNGAKPHSRQLSEPVVPVGKFPQPEEGRQGLSAVAPG